MDGIYFPGIGIRFPHVPEGITIGNFTIRFYGIVIAVGFILALLVSFKEARRTGQKEDDYLDFLLILIIPAILGARIYYILFNLDAYVQKGKGFGQTLLDMLNIRNGGLAIYGGLIAGLITAIIFTRKRHLSLPLFGDTAAMGILIGQILGRWGNFFNREAFGAYTSSVFRMAIPLGFYEKQGNLSYLVRTHVITEEMLTHTETVSGQLCITVHPTFFYEGCWNLLLLILLFCCRKHKKFDGELILLYVTGYGLGRALVETLRSDSLMIGPMKVSQLLGGICFVGGLVTLILLSRRKNFQQTAKQSEKQHVEEQK